MKSFLALLRHGFSRAAMAATVVAAVALIGCGGTAQPKKETDPAKLEQQRVEAAKQFEREVQNK